ncbi:MAG TPA: D-alanyl-D-alanine carboxypeptidase, partial [Rhodocyclaceae bacterium]|nr:D-alanyl-D-alanine carboxypeptidase [Rhodocyclaceae bacterium]
MNRYLLMAVALLLGPSWVAAQADARLPATVAHALAAAHIPVSAVGIVVQETGAATPRLAVNTGQAMNPASTMKLVTTFAGLELLGPAYTW